MVAYTLPAGSGGKTVSVELNDAEVSGGKLGGLLQFRASSLDFMQAQLGQMAVGLAMTFNEQHRQGLDTAGNAGTDFFSIGSPQGVPNANNKSGAQPAARSRTWTTSTPRTTKSVSTARITA